MSTRARVFSVLALVGLLAWAGFGNFFDRAQREASALIPDNALRLGLDLRGGAHVVLGPDLEASVTNELARIDGVLTDRFETDGITAVRTIVSGQELRIQPSAQSDADKIRTLLDEDFGVLQVNEESGSAGAPTQFRATLLADEADAVRERAIQQVLEVLRRRINDPQTGIAESVVTRQGESRVLVQIPGVDRVPEGIVKTTGLLEFKIVKGYAETPELLREQFTTAGLPEGTEIAVERDAPVGDEVEGPVIGAYLLNEVADITGEHLVDAYSRFDQQMQEWQVSFVWSDAGSKIFAALTEANINQPLAVLLDGDVVTAPTIRGRISRQGQITGGYSQQGAAELAIILRAGSLPIDITIEEERTIGPALGQDSIDRGLRASLAGLLVIMVFVAVYYKLSGVYAGIGLIANLVMLFGLMSLFEATLTLPGIAGLVLTVGMAVDANVIIFERIREELRAGRAPRAAIAAGFQKARAAILDANVTTLFTAIILFQFGTGPIKGFAVTLSVGILTSVFAALVITRLLYEWKPGQANVTELSI